MFSISRRRKRHCFGPMHKKKVSFSFLSGISDCLSGITGQYLLLKPVLASSVAPDGKKTCKETTIK